MAPRCMSPLKDADVPLTGHASMEKVFIGISGLIGAGKTTLARALADVMNLPVHYEPVVDNEYLTDFYKDMKKYAFPMQIYLLNARFKQHQQIIWQGMGGIQDRTIYEDSVFAKMLADGGMMEKRDYQTYVNLFSNMANFMRKPNLIIHLDVTPEESMERIRQRSREAESTISIEYLSSLRDAYEDFITDISRVIPVIKVRWNKFKKTEEVAEIIKQQYLLMYNIKNVNFPPSKERGESPPVGITQV